MSNYIETIEQLEDVLAKRAAARVLSWLEAAVQ